jgi:hypothetical protein
MTSWTRFSLAALVVALAVGNGAACKRKAKTAGSPGTVTPSASPAAMTTSSGSPAPGALPSGTADDVNRAWENLRVGSPSPPAEGTQGRQPSPPPPAENRHGPR